MLSSAPSRLSLPALTLAAALSAGFSDAGATAAGFFWGNPKPQGNELRGVGFATDQIGYAVGLRGTCLATTDGGATWTDRTDFAAFSTDLMDILVLGPGEALAVGGPPGIFRTTDGGGSWTPVANPSTGQLNEISRIGGTVLSAVGRNNQVLRSTDDGDTWQLLNGPGANAEIVDQFWRSPNEGYVLGPFVLRRTTNAGASWSPVPGTDESSFFPGDIQFLDANNGWILVDFTTYRTTDGGASWFEKHGQIGQAPIYQEEALILDSDNRYVVTEAEGAEIWRTTDDGLHWTQLYARQRTVGYTDIVRLGDGALIVVSTDGDLLRSTNAGAGWTNFTTSPGDGERVDMSAIAFLPGGKGIAGGGGLFMESLDGGESWQTIADPPSIQSPNAIAFRDDLLGLAGGYSPGGDSKVSRTSDGGATWTEQSIAENYVGNPTGIDMVGDRCYTCLYGGSNVNYVYASTDAGLTWSPATNGISASERLECIDFIDGSTGYAGGGDFEARLYRTTNGGQTWTVVQGAGLPDDMIMDMKWFDALAGVIVSFSGIHRTTNGGASWSYAAGSWLTDLAFQDDQVGYACGYFDPVAWRTEDGGATWESIDLPWTEGPSAIAPTPLGFVTCGSSSVILGAVLLDPASAGGMWTDSRGRSGLMHGDLGAGVSVRATSALATRGPVGLRVDASAARVPGIAIRGSVLDLGGRRIADLSIRPLAPSVWEAVWDGGRDGAGASPPGVYFLRLERDGRRGAVKCIRLP